MCMTFCYPDVILYTLGEIFFKSHDFSFKVQIKNEVPFGDIDWLQGVTMLKRPKPAHISLRCLLGQ